MLVLARRIVGLRSLAEDTDQESLIQALSNLDNLNIQIT